MPTAILSAPSCAKRCDRDVTEPVATIAQGRRISALLEELAGQLVRLGIPAAAAARAATATEGEG